MAYVCLRNLLNIVLCPAFEYIDIETCCIQGLSNLRHARQYYAAREVIYILIVLAELMK